MSSRNQKRLSESLDMLAGDFLSPSSAHKVGNKIIHYNNYSIWASKLTQQPFRTIARYLGSGEDIKLRFEGRVNTTTLIGNICQNHSLVHV